MTEEQKQKIRQTHIRLAHGERMDRRRPKRI